MTISRGWKWRIFIMLKMNFAFSKTGRMKFISHLDLMRLFTRAMRRARIPVKVSEGFNPHPKLSIARAIKLGVESGNEAATVVLREPLNAREFIEKLNGQLPEGIRVVEASQTF
jgi:radical SAM-linked protein